MSGVWLLGGDGIELGRLTTLLSWDAPQLNQQPERAKGFVPGTTIWQRGQK